MSKQLRYTLYVEYLDYRIVVPIMGWKFFPYWRRALSPVEVLEKGQYDKAKAELTVKHGLTPVELGITYRIARVEPYPSRHVSYEPPPKPPAMHTD